MAGKANGKEFANAGGQWVKAVDWKRSATGLGKFFYVGEGPESWEHGNGRRYGNWA